MILQVIVFFSWFFELFFFYLLLLIVSVLLFILILFLFLIFYLLLYYYMIIYDIVVWEITQPLRLFKSEQPWCRSQARINGEGCDRKGIRRKTQPNIFQCAL